MEKEKNRIPEKVLIVDDLEMNVDILANIIQTEGYEPLCALNVQEALDIMNREMPQLILSDYSMPGMNGVEFCKLLKKKPKTRDIPFMLITVADSSEVKRTAFEAGAVDYIPKPFERIEVVMRIRHQMETYRAKQEIMEHNRRMHHVIAEQKEITEREQENLLIGLVKVVEKLDHKKGMNLERIGANCRVLAQSLQLTEQYEDEINDAFTDTIYTAAKLHNIGALAVSEETVPESGRGAGNREWIEIHTKEGAKLLKDIAKNSSTSRFLAMAVEIAENHHTYWDGSGYPEQVKGTDIPLSARIVSVISAFDAEYSRQGEDEEAAQTALAFVKSLSGTRFDPGIVSVFTKIAKQLKLEKG